MAEQEPYIQQYEAAEKFFDDDSEKCIELCKANISDPTIPNYYLIMNLILIVSAMDDWDEADFYRLAAEHAWETTHHRALQRNEQEEMEALSGLRDELDQLKSFRERDLAEYYDSDEETEMQDAEDEDEIGFENPRDVADAENEIDHGGRP
ncbi:hypothetical protein DM02DRAFT_514854 [Periconia macrospinosa]|uniref:Uncharacterized protein n=1 Tax=Periconia macrospinosa TaxID=97972 RepID=A0A2V1EAG6_9PLEO|nr:hypothetical protein DM02DRAFT_514854 [Periconia macrospinosa]